MTTLIIIIAFAAYTTIIITVSGSLNRTEDSTKCGKRFDVRNAAAWVFALLSTFGLPWGGIPLSRYLGFGSWTWFLFAGISLCIFRNDGRESCMFRRFLAIVNLTVIMTAIYVFMFDNGIPGDIPGIEGVGAINSLKGFYGKELMLAQVCFLVSAIASFLPVYTHSERASAILSFSYASFLSIAFLPPAHIFITSVRPDAAILIDAATYFILSCFLHTFVMNKLSGKAASIFGRSYVVINTAFTTAGIYFLLSLA